MNIIGHGPTKSQAFIARGIGGDRYRRLTICQARAFPVGPHFPRMGQIQTLVLGGKCVL